MSDLTFSLKALARSANVQQVQICQWMKAYHQLKHRSLHLGCLSSFPQVENLLTWIRDMRETGTAVSVNMTVIRESQIDQVFRCKSSSAKYSTIRCLIQSNGIVIRLKTHEASREERRSQSLGCDCCSHPNTAQSPSGLDSKHGSDPSSFYQDTQDYIE